MQTEIKYMLAIRATFLYKRMTEREDTVFFIWMRPTEMQSPGNLSNWVLSIMMLLNLFIIWVKKRSFISHNLVYGSEVTSLPRWHDSWIWTWVTTLYPWVLIPDCVQSWTQILIPAWSLSNSTISLGFAFCCCLCLIWMKRVLHANVRLLKNAFKEHRVIFGQNIKSFIIH